MPTKNEIIKASLEAGLREFGLPNNPNSGAHAAIKKFGLDKQNYAKVIGSGLVWGYPTKIVKISMKDLIAEYVKNMGEDFIEWMEIGDEFCYLFDLDGNGTPADRNFFEAIKKVKTYANKVYMFTGEAEILEITMNIKSPKQWLDFAKNELKKYNY